MKLHILILITSVISASLSFAGIEQSVGYYTQGRLVNPSSLPAEGDGFIKIRRPRVRGFASSELNTMIQVVAQEVRQSFPNRDRLQIGDVANQKGGTLGKHKSHQNGLDADIVYYRTNNKEQDPNWAGGYVEKFVRGGAVTANFDQDRNWELLKKLASFPQTERIFVDYAIKKTFCSKYSKSTDPVAQEALRIMRPAKLHDDHMHVRIQCPPGSTRCKRQEPPAPGNGCNPINMEIDLMINDFEEESGC